MPLSRTLRRVEICAESGARPGAFCPSVEEWFRPAHAPLHECPLHTTSHTAGSVVGADFQADLVRPTPGLHLAMDPRIPDELEIFEFSLETNADPSDVEWIVDGEPHELRRSGDTRWEWPLSRGPHRVRARAHFAADVPALETREVSFFSSLASLFSYSAVVCL